MRSDNPINLHHLADSHPHECQSKQCNPTNVTHLRHHNNTLPDLAHFFLQKNKECDIEQSSAPLTSRWPSKRAPSRRSSTFKVAFANATLFSFKTVLTCGAMAWRLPGDCSSEASATCVCLLDNAIEALSAPGVEAPAPLATPTH